MRVHKASLALATIIAALTGASVTDNASAGLTYDGLWGGRGGFQLYRAPQPNARLPGATSRPSNRDMRGPPDKGGGRGMRGMGGSRMNGSMGRR
jgi:hypothetical protein